MPAVFEQAAKFGTIYVSKTAHRDEWMMLRQHRLFLMLTANGLHEWSLYFRCFQRQSHSKVIHQFPSISSLSLIPNFKFQSAEKRQTPTPTDQSSAAPNYLRHPVLGYKVDVTDIPEEGAGEGVVVNHAANHDAFAGKKKAMPSFRILKVNKEDG